MSDSSYNRFSAIAIGGTYVNNIPTIYGNVSLDVSGHTAIRGNLYISGTANIDVSGGGFSGTDLSLNGNIYLGGDLYSSNPFSSMNIYGNTITHYRSDGVQCMTQIYDYGPDDVEWRSNKNFTINTNDGKDFGVASGRNLGFDASLSTTFSARNGQISFLAEQADILMDASQNIEITSRKSDIYLYPRNGVNGNVFLEGKLQLLNGIHCREASNVLNVTNTQYLDIYGTGGLTQIDLYQAGSTAKSVSVGLNTTTNSGYIGSAGTNVDFSIGTGRYIRLQQPIYVDYVYADISRSNWQIGWTQNTANPNTGTTFSGTASDTGTPAQVATFDLPSFGVWLIQFNCLLTLNTGSDTINDRGITLSDTTASNTPCAPGFRMTDPIDDAAGSAGARQTYSFSGIYHHTAPGTAAKFINVFATTNGSRTVTASGSYKYTRIA
jgi:hypothetical protein